MATNTVPSIVGAHGRLSTVLCLYHINVTSYRSIENETARPALLDVTGLRTEFFTDGGLVRAVRGVSFSVARGEVLGLVGESGCGKSVTALSLMRLIPDPPGRIVGGRILLNGRDLLGLTDREMRAVRGNEVGMVFQDPMSSLNPAMTIGRQIAEALELHRSMRRAAALRRAVELLEMVGIPDPHQQVRRYPHHLSGGMRQRVMIAMALSCEPDLLIADESTTALDVTIQAQILELMKKLRTELDMAIILITHDLGVVAGIADRINVMYAGHIVETGSVDDIFSRPRHPYTLGLLSSIVRLDTPRHSALAAIPGTPPDPRKVPPGCPFQPRCTFAVAQSAEENPRLVEVEPGHSVACWVDASSERGTIRVGVQA